MRIRKLVTATAVAAAAVVASPGIARADSVYVSGQLNTGGHLVQYSTYRTHTFTGPSTST